MGVESSSSPELSIVIPCLNEAETIRACIQKAHAFLHTYDVAGEVIVADNGSTDGADRIAESCGARVIRVAEKGYGAALMGGLASARGQYVVMGDADDSYDFAAIGPFLHQLRGGYDLVMGCRFPRRGGKIMPGAMSWSHRWIGNPVLSGLGRLFFHSGVSDFHCGLRAFRRDVIKALHLCTTGMEFASEMVIKATLRGLRITEVPIILYKDGRTRASHLRTWRDGWRHLRFMLLYSPRWLFLYPGLLLLIGGAAVELWLLPGQRRIGNIIFDVHTLLYASMAIVIGFQAVNFAVFAKVFAISEGLLPESPFLNNVFRVITLEVGLVVGALCIMGGLAASAWALTSWSERSFAALDPVKMLRLVIPATTFLTLGCQTVFSSFFLSLLGLRRRKG